MKAVANIFSYLSKHIVFLLGAVLLLGLILRIFNLWDNVLFAYDQARDAQRIMGIISLQHFKIVGPETDIPGVFNGALFYYMLAPLYFIFRLDPNGVALGIALINILTAVLVYYTGKILFNNKYIGFLSAFFWAISFEQIAYSHYISNASFMGGASLIFFMGCAMYFIQKKELGLPISALGLGLAIHFNFYLIYLFIFYVIFGLLFRRRYSFKTSALSFLVLFLLLLPFGLAEIQFHFSITKSLFSFITHQGNGVKSIGTIIEDTSHYLGRITDAVRYSYFSFNTYLAFFFFGFFVVFTYFKVKERKSLYFIYIWLFSTLPLFIFHSGVLTVQVINSSLQGAFAILMAIGLWILFKHKELRILGIVLLLLIAASNILLLQRENFVPNSFFVSGGMTIGYQKQVVDYTYKEAAGKPFSICAVTNPLFINTVWGYLYNWYGKGKYGYLPYWAGLKQDLQMSLLTYDTQHVQLRFLIQEPLIGIPDMTVKATVFMEDHASRLVEQKNFGGIIVQKRLLQEGERSFIDTQNLSKRHFKDLVKFTNAASLYSCYNTY